MNYIIIRLISLTDFTTKMNKIILFIILFLFNIISASAVPKQSPKLKLPWDKERVTLAQKGDPDAQAYVGWCYYMGEDGVKENNYED